MRYGRERRVVRQINFSGIKMVRRIRAWSFDRTVGGSLSFHDGDVPAEEKCLGRRCGTKLSLSVRVHFLITKGYVTNQQYRSFQRGSCEIADSGIEGPRDMAHESSKQGR